tara:strand:- start:894 stop:1193 length:300 start_codon:yes stop_codon:yes gene_type:complete
MDLELGIQTLVVFMPHKPNKFKNLNQVTVKKQVIRTSPYVKPAFGTCTEAQFIRIYLKEMELMKNHPDPKAQEALNFRLENIWMEDPQVKAAAKAKGYF